MSLSTHKPVQGNIIAAMAWRVKYRITDEDTVQWVPIMSLGVHGKNRGGPYPAGLRCRALCESSVTRGFNKEEVNHAGVVVEERPIAAVAGIDYVSMSVHNKEKTEAREAPGERGKTSRDGGTKGSRSSSGSRRHGGGTA